MATVRPFLRVVVWVLMGAETGVAKFRRRGAEGNALLVRPLERFRASLRDAIVSVCQSPGLIWGTVNGRPGSELRQQVPGDWRGTGLDGWAGWVEAFNRRTKLMSSGKASQLEKAWPEAFFPVRTRANQERLDDLAELHNPKNTPAVLTASHLVPAWKSKNSQVGGLRAITTWVMEQSYLGYRRSFT